MIYCYCYSVKPSNSTSMDPMNDVLKKANKIKSIREILDQNKDGQVSKKEVLKALTDEEIMERIKKLHPIMYYLMKNQAFKLETTTKKPTSAYGRGGEENNVKLVKKGVKSFRKDRAVFGTVTPPLTPWA